MDDSYVIIPRNVIGNIALVAFALHESGLSEEEITNLLQTLASDEEVLDGIADFIEESAIGTFDIDTLIQEANLG